MGKKDTTVETACGKAQRQTATCYVDRRPRQDCRELMDAGDIGPLTLVVYWPMFSSGQQRAEMMMMMMMMSAYL